MIAGFFAFPEQIWKKQMILMTQSTAAITPYAAGTISVQNSSAVQINISRCGNSQRPGNAQSDHADQRRKLWANWELITRISRISPTGRRFMAYICTLLEVRAVSSHWRSSSFRI